MGAEGGKQEKESKPEEQPADPRAAARALMERYREGQSATNAAAKARGDERKALWLLAKAHGAARAAAARLRQAKAKKIRKVDELEKEAEAAAEKVRRLTPPYTILKEAAEQLGHGRNEPKPDSREQVLQQLPRGNLFLPSKELSSAQSPAESQKSKSDKEWDRIALHMLHAARLRQAQQQEEAEREQLLDRNCIERLRMFQEYRRHKEYLEEQAKLTKHPAPPPPRHVWGLRRPW
eukprot:TRINITY_DN24235_c0_g3_i1.p1 TRINITY_DN24235_c0_g3~~TRINITY_DN24235_c0_g3_i1.p1  ORF type:complete len:266 (+),score=123.09 TRINITY_DN24235_c0_g3_i1:91-798(+)